MRTTVDIPDPLLDAVRARLKAQGRTLREEIIEGLRRSLREDGPAQVYRMPEAAFQGRVGFAPGFDAADLDAAIRADADGRLAADGPGSYRASP